MVYVLNFSALGDQLNNYIKYAEKLTDKGLSVTPVKDKRPWLKDWQLIETDEILDKKHAGAWQKANGLGLILGEMSGIICFDIDILEGNERLAEIRKDLLDLLPPLYCGLTGNPKKPPARLYKYSGEAGEKFKFIDVELLSDGNQKVIPPSKHPNKGVVYSWEGKSLYDIDVDDLPELPTNVLEFCRDRNEELRYSNESKTTTGELTSERGRCKHGFHSLISQRCLRYFYQGWSFEDIASEALRFDADTHTTTADVGDVLYFLCKSRKEFKSKNPNVNANRFVSEIFFRNTYKRYDESEFFKEELANGFTFREGTNGTGRYHRQHISLYNYLKIKSDVWYCPDMKSFQFWDGKKYDRKPDDYLKQFAQKHFKKPSCVAIGEKNTFVDYAKNEQQATAKEFNLRDTGCANLRNGVYDFKTGKLYKHSKALKMPYLIDVNYVEDGDTPIWDTLLELITLNRPHMITAIEEYIGYAISGCNYNRFNKLLILDGGGSNGKSTLIRVINQMIGNDNTSSISLESIKTERFAGFNLVNKLINFCAEEPRESFSNTGPIKKITGGDPMMVEEKNKGAFQYENLAKLIISYNKMPFFPDDSIGMRRRIMLIPCEQDFEKRPDLKIKDVEKRIFNTEQAQVLSRCVRAFRGVMERGYFTEVEEGDARVQEMIIDSNPVLEFIAEYITVKDDDSCFVSSAKIYENFLNFTGKKSKYTRDGFFKKFKPEILKNDAVFNDNKPSRGYRCIVMETI